MIVSMTGGKALPEGIVDQIDAPWKESHQHLGLFAAPTDLILERGLPRMPASQSNGPKILGERPPYALL